MIPHDEIVPPYTPRANSSAPSFSNTAESRPIGLPPVAPAVVTNPVNLHNFRTPMWSATSSPSARHYRNVVERRITDGRCESYHAMRPGVAGRRQLSNRHDRHVADSHMAAGAATAQVQGENPGRETADNILEQEDQQWDSMLGKKPPSIFLAVSVETSCLVCANHCLTENWRSQKEKEKSWTRFRQGVEARQRKKRFRGFGIGIGLLPP